MSELRVMDGTGDTKLIWDSGNADEVKTAKKTFEDLTAKGFKAFAVKKSGKPGEQIKKFDPEAEKIILIPQMLGG
jgi:hypothetical protein